MRQPQNADPPLLLLLLPSLLLPVPAATYPDVPNVAVTIASARQQLLMYAGLVSWPACLPLPALVVLVLLQLAAAAARCRCC